MGKNGLGKRLGVEATPAKRTLARLKKYGVIKELEKGTQHSKEGGSGKATRYQYLLVQ